MTARKPKASTLKNKADRLFSELVRARGRCQLCGRYNLLQCAHIRSRKYNATRCDLENAWCLCAGCHMKTHADGVLFADLVDMTIGREKYEELRTRSYVPTKGTVKFWQAEIERLQHAATVPYAGRVSAEDL